MAAAMSASLMSLSTIDTCFVPGAGAQLAGAPDAPGLLSCATPGLAPTASTERTAIVATAPSLRALFEMSTAITLLDFGCQSKRCDASLDWSRRNDTA